jgi:predicted MFS family arabinose efflux permease
MVIGYFSSLLLTERLGKVRTASLVQVLSIPFLLLFTVTSAVAFAAFAFVMRYLLMNMANPVLSSFKLEIVREKQRALVNSLTWMACYTFVGVGTYAGGWMLAGGAYALPFQLTCVIYGLAAAMFYFYFNEIETRSAIREVAA